METFAAKLEGWPLAAVIIVCVPAGIFGWCVIMNGWPEVGDWIRAWRKKK